MFLVAVSVCSACCILLTKTATVLRLIVFVVSAVHIPQSMCVLLPGVALAVDGVVSVAKLSYGQAASAVTVDVQRLQCVLRSVGHGMAARAGWQGCKTVSALSQILP